MRLNRFVAMPLAALAFATVSSPVLAADQGQMLSNCSHYAAHHLHVSLGDIDTVKYEGQRTDGTHAINGTTMSGQSFQCSFSSSGRHIVQWWHSPPPGCPVDVSEADRYRYPDCN